MQLLAALNFLVSIYGMAIGSYVDLEDLCNIFGRGTRHSRCCWRLDIDCCPDSPLGIEFRNVYFAYPSRKQVNVLKGISFVVPAGSTAALVGETGSGKSTIGKFLFRFYEADRGEVLVGGQNVLDLTQTSLRRKFGIVPQDPMLFNDTLKYNIAYGCKNVTNDEQVRKAVSAAELDSFVSELPDGLETVVGERGQQVSGGQKQRSAIARVLIKDSTIVIFEEATSSLDSLTEERIQAALESLRGRTMLIIALLLSSIQHAD